MILEDVFCTLLTFLTGAAFCSASLSLDDDELDDEDDFDLRAFFTRVEVKALTGVCNFFRFVAGASSSLS